MPVKNSDISENNSVNNSPVLNKSPDNTGVLIFFILLSTFITIVSSYIISSGGKIAGIDLGGTRQAVREEILQNEYSKVGGKENFEIINKMQLEQIKQYIAQYKAQNPDSKKDGKTGETDNKAADSGAEAKTMTKDEISALKTGSHFEGAKDALITIYEFSDLECPFCIRQFKDGTIKAQLEKFGEKINTTFKMFPLDFHKNAPKEAEATLCAGEIGGDAKYVEFHNKIFERTSGNGEGFSLDNLVPLAKEIGLNEAKFKECLDSGKMADKIKSDTELGKKYGVTGTPGSVIVNNETGKYFVIAGAYPASEFEAKINELLK